MQYSLVTVPTGRPTGTVNRMNLTCAPPSIGVASEDRDRTRIVIVVQLDIGGLDKQDILAVKIVPTID